MSDATELARLRWACRRGMLELDTLLTPFLEQGYPALSPAAQGAFARLLECSDLELFRWLLGRESPADPELQSIIGAILAYHQA
ncbi:succinate dehydrogenase assembly factor 2 [Pseudaeromonas sp. ZJS20]|uniref:FAD assembly factor SdhE n=1 Tax=Pseudaeromonas aegiceratis TaxID=3153928 RepID=UPI00390C8240